jgi:putative transposase
MNKYRRIGYFWQDRYKSIILAKDEYLLACGSYVELNPVRAKMADDPKEYRWSSYHAYAYGKKDQLINEHPIYEQLGTEGRERQQKYREYVKGMLREKKATKGEMDRRQAYGSESFTEKMNGQFQLTELIKQRGRPKKEDDDENKCK